MAVGEGKFVLYSRIEPPLEAGDYRFVSTQTLTAGGHSASELPVAELNTHVSVRSPRFTLPPDQVLSTFPPAASEGAYGSRLPQIVLRRRTLPWERIVQTGVSRATPWLALVLIAEGEAELKLNVPVADCVTPGKSLPGKADVELGNCLHIRKSVVDRIFPTQLDVPLLAHAREVDIHDTELMMGDDDGFLAVVIANRLPLAGVDAGGEPIPVKYLACLVNLEGQFFDLLERAPEPQTVTKFPGKAFVYEADTAKWDHAKMGTTSVSEEAEVVHVKGLAASGTAPYEVKSTWSASAETERASADVYLEMARDFGRAVKTGFVAGAGSVAIDPTLRFPVLLHWSFTSFGDVTFRSLMENLKSGLLGTVEPETPGAGPNRSGRLPLEVVETGHVGLAHRNRRGDAVRSWYRGPFTPHPGLSSPTDRLPLAHAADQLRIIVPDGREDISLASAFEIGRLLALSRPSMIAALMRWRQTGYQAARRKAVWKHLTSFVDEVVGLHGLDRRIGMFLGRGLAERIVTTPREFLGDPRPPVDGGRPIVYGAPVEQVLAQGFGIAADIFRGEPDMMLSRLRDTSVLRPSDPDDVKMPMETLTATLNNVVGRLVDDMLAHGFEPGRDIRDVEPGRGVEPDRFEPGRASGPGIRVDRPGIRDDGPGIRDDGPDVRDDGPGIREDGPGLRHDGPGIREGGPGVREDGHGIHIDLGEDHRDGPGAGSVGGDPR